MLDIQSMILAQRVMVLKRFTNKDNNSSWKITLNYFLSQVGGEFILKCHFDTRQLPIYLPAFYKECLDAWSMLRQPSILSYEDVVHQVIWNDKNITVQKLSLFEKHLLSKGIVTIGDLISDTGIFLKGVKVLHANLAPIQHFKLMNVVDAIPRDLRRIIRQSALYLPSHTDDIIYLKLGNSEVIIAKVTSKSLRNAFKSKKQFPPTAQKNSRKNFHSFRLTGRKYTPCLLPSQLKLKLENSNIKY